MPPVRQRAAVVLALTLAACQAAPGGSATSGQRVEVSVSESGCAPTAITVPSGPVTFLVTNAGGDVGEFEIIEGGQRVIDEVENIVPGFVVNMATRVDGGTYELLCGNTRAPRGALTVNGGPAATRPPSAVVDAAALETAVAGYAEYVLTQTTDLVTAIDAFTAAVDGGDLVTAQALYRPARIPWERIEPIAELFPDLDGRIDFREEDFELGVDDPEFRGFHRLEKILFADATTDGTAELTEDLRTDVADLQTRIEALEIDPRVMARGAGELIEEVAQSKMTGEEDRYSKADLYSIDANVDGSRQIVEFLRPIVADLDADYLARLDASLTAVEEVIGRYAEGDGFRGFDAMSGDDLKALQARLADLTESLAELPGRLGLEA